MKRTSVTHPLQIAAVGAGSGRGRIGVTFCRWERDLALDLDAIRQWAPQRLSRLWRIGNSDF
jgi:hypothetical protein